MIMRAAYLGLCGLLFAGIVHIAVILLIPHVGSKDAAKKIIGSGQTLEFELIEDKSSLQIADDDPFFKTAVCRFNLTESGVQIIGREIPNFWSASVFDEDGRVVYSLNNRTAIRNLLNLLVVNPVQMADIRQIQPEEIETSIIVQTGSDRGFVILRALVRDESYEEDALNFLNTATCSEYATR